MAAHHVWEAIYDGPYDSRKYAHQPVILTGSPSLDDGTAAIEAITVQAGERVVDVGGRVVELAPGVTIEEVQAKTGFSLEIGDLEETTAPTEEEVRLLEVEGDG